MNVSMDTPSYDSRGQLEFAVKQILNSLSSRRVIGQAEAHHSALNLPLTLCSENMIEIRISGWTRIKQNIFKNMSKKNMDIFYKYALREDRHEMSLWQYFHSEYNRIDSKHACFDCSENTVLYIPYATGLNCNPTFPVTAAYARGSLIKHKAWSKHHILDLNLDTNVLHEYELFLDNLPSTHIMKLEFARAKSQSESTKRIGEPTNTNIDPSSNIMELINYNEDKYEVENLLKAFNSVTWNMKTTFEYGEWKFDRGVHYEWDKRKFERDPSLTGNTWLEKNINKENTLSNSQISELIFSLKYNGDSYKLDDLSSEQAHIALVVINKIIEWMDFPGRHRQNNNVTFNPLRITVVGKAGTGKSFLIHTIVTAVKMLTGVNNSVFVTAPTGKYK